MNKILETLFLPQLNQCGFQLCKNNNNLDHFYSFELSNRIGKGVYEVVTIEDKFAIVSKDFAFYDEAKIIWSQPEYLNIGHAYNENQKLDIFWSKGDTYSFILPAQSTVSGMSISIMPEYYAMLLDYFPEMSSQELLQMLSIAASCSEFSPALEILNQIKKLPVKGRAATMYYDGKIRELFALLIQWYDMQNYVKEAVSISNSDKEALSYLIHKMKQTLSNPMSISQCTKITCMGKSKLSLLFHQMSGKTISEYYQELRIQKAKELLGYTDMEIIEIANRVGYRTHAAFSSLFKSMCGQTPSQYRKSHQNH